MRTPLVTILLTIVFAPLSNATLIPTGADDAVYRSYGSTFAGQALWLRGTKPDGTEYHTSAIRFNSEYALTAAHNIYYPDGLATLYEVGTGSNYLTDPGTTANVISYKANEAYVADPDKFQFKFTPDIAILKLQTPLSGQSMSIGGLAVGEVGHFAGFGQHGDPSTGYLPQDGFARAFNAPMTTSVPFNIGSQYYAAARFGIGAEGVTFNGKGGPGDSGGLMINDQGELAGITEAITGDASVNGRTIYLKLDVPEVRDWILANTILSEPHPGDFSDDLVVDASDYVVWRKSTGTVENYNLWRSHFGESVANGSNLSIAVVPEPTLLRLLLTGATAFFLRPPR